MYVAVSLLHCVAKGSSLLYLQCVAVYCRVLQCVAMCCSVLQSVAVCCSVSVAGCCKRQLVAQFVVWFILLQCVGALCCSMLEYVAVCCSVLQCVAECCRVLQCVAVCCSPSCVSARNFQGAILQHTATRCNTLQHTATRDTFENASE